MSFKLLMKDSRKWVPWILADILIFTVLAIVSWYYWPAKAQSEFQLYFARMILDGQVPYVDFTSEYPPLALLSCLLPALVGRTLTTYYIGFIIELLLFDLLAMFLITKISAWLGIPAKRPLLIHALLLIAVGPMIGASFDMIPAVLVLAALGLFVDGRGNAAWAVVGLGFLTKLYPVIVAPFFLIYHLCRKQYKRAARGAAISLSIVLAGSLSFIALNAGGFWATFSYHIERGLHSETIYATVLSLGKILGLVQVEGMFNYGSWNLASPLADNLAGSAFIITAGLLVAVYFLYLRSVPKGAAVPDASGLVPEMTATLMKYATAAVFIFMLAGKVFSMQYLIWLCPLLPLVTGRWQLPILATFVVAAAISQFIYPHHYVQFELFEPSIVVVMFIRNCLLLVSLVLFLLPGDRRPSTPLPYRG